MLSPPSSSASRCSLDLTLSWHLPYRVAAPQPRMSRALPCLTCLVRVVMRVQGLVSDRGIRPGYALERVVGALIDGDAQWLRDRNEGLQADAPLLVRAPIFALFLAAGLLLNRLLLVALEDGTFVISIGICSCIGAGLLEVIRQPLPTRAERDLERTLSDEFLLFSAERLSVGGRCHEREIVRAFRAFYPRYRYADMDRYTDGQSVPDSNIAQCVRRWNVSMGRPGERTSSGYYKGISLLEAPAAVGGKPEA